MSRLRQLGRKHLRCNQALLGRNAFVYLTIVRVRSSSMSEIDGHLSKTARWFPFSIKFQYSIHWLTSATRSQTVLNTSSRGSPLFDVAVGHSVLMTSFRAATLDKTCSLLFWKQPSSNTALCQSGERRIKPTRHTVIEIKDLLACQSSMP